jgi:hypothetical protein
MAFGEHLRQSASTENTDDTADKEASNGPDMVDPDRESEAHLRAFQDVLGDVAEHLRSQGDTRSAERVPLIAKGMLDYRGTGASLADICDKVANHDGAPQDQMADKAADLKTAQMLSDHLEQSGVDLDLVAEQFQKLSEQAEDANGEISGDEQNVQESMTEAHSPTEASENLPVLADMPIFGMVPFKGNDPAPSALSVPDRENKDEAIDAEYEVVKEGEKPGTEMTPSSGSLDHEKKDEPKDGEEDEDEDDLTPNAREIGESLVLLSMHMQSARTRKQISQAELKRREEIRNPEKKPNQDQQAGSGFHPRIPRLKIPGDVMDYEAFMRNRRTGQMLATRDAILKMDRLSSLREKTTDPKVLKTIDDNLGKQAHRLLKHGSSAFDQKGLDFMMRGGADPKLITNTMERMEQWKKRFAPDDDMQNNFGDSLRKSLEMLAKLIQRVIDRVTGRGPSQSSEQVRSAPTMSAD